MKKNIIVNPIGPKGNEIKERMMELMGIQPINENKTNVSVELTKIGPDGKAYAIIRENHKWYIKKADKTIGLIAEDFKYIGGLQNKKLEAYSSYAKAIKHLNLKFRSLAEAYNYDGEINVFKNDNLLTEVGMVGFSEMKGNGFAPKEDMEEAKKGYPVEEEVEMEDYEKAIDEMLTREDETSDSENFFDWNGTINGDMLYEIKLALESYGGRQFELFRDYIDSFDGEKGKELYIALSDLFSRRTSEYVDEYDELPDNIVRGNKDDDKKASEVLSKAGFSGIKYPNEIVKFGENIDEMLTREDETSDSENFFDWNGTINGDMLYEIKLALESYGGRQFELFRDYIDSFDGEKGKELYIALSDLFSRRTSEYVDEYDELPDNIVRGNKDDDKKASEVLSKAGFSGIKYPNEIVKFGENIDERKSTFPDLTGDGKVTRADILKGRGVDLKEGLKKKVNQKKFF